ncbi:S26 family signal peptidase [Curtobacterium sp. SGAir0471]|uniref:S26 family signal peptidase n=1 Tax=Curtobacterium sp. SGAir0471 TaxID=2070337 RepID=UPI001586425C|nr:S26 family signal peptidase [Curtobacterium sp. SGAir0471]
MTAGTADARIVPTARRRRAPGRAVRVRVVVAVAVVLLVLLAIGVAMAAGVRTFDVRTPSMGRAAPVGSLVVTVPPGQHRLAVGDVVTFVPPVTEGSGTAARLPYTHRVTAVVDGAITTKGDANGAADAWTISRGDVVGRVVAVLPGGGWVLRMVPWTAGGIGLVWLLTGSIAARATRTAARLVGVSAVLAVVVAVFRPFVALVVTGVDPGARPTAHVVSTGLLPIRAVGPSGASDRLLSGSVGQVALPPGSDGAVALTAQLDLSPLGWVTLALVCAVPLVLGVLLARSSRRAPSERVDAADVLTGRPTDRTQPRPTDRAEPRPTDRAEPRPTDRGTDRGTDRAEPRPTDRGTDRGTDRSTDRPADSAPHRVAHSTTDATTGRATTDPAMTDPATDATTDLATESPVVPTVPA